MDHHNACSRIFVGVGELDLSVQTPRTQQCWIKCIRSVRGSNDFHSRSGRETIQLIEKLEHGPLDFADTSLIAAARTLLANGIKLIDENDGGRFLTSQSKRITHNLRTITDKHLHKLWTSKLQKRRIRRCCACACHHRLASARRSMHQHTFRWHNANCFKALLMRHRQHNSFDKLFDLLVQTTNVTILICGSLIDFHCLHSRIVLCWKLI
mmetsp:Transcript_11394/g.18688  ORF Transcript_11394/g.18688 Transcript_11394/m.18688 type:complete len:210 (-) Transcript_11394:563-1192(-)